MKPQNFKLSITSIVEGVYLDVCAGSLQQQDSYNHLARINIISAVDSPIADPVLRKKSDMCQLQLPRHYSEPGAVAPCVRKASPE